MQLVTLSDLARPEEELAPLIAQAQRLGDLWLEFIKQDTDAHEYAVTIGGEKDRSAGIHASEMSKCMLRLVYSIAGVERKPDAQAQKANMKLRFRTGSAVHSMIQSDFKRMAAWYTKNHQAQGWALTFASELPVRKDLQEIAKAWDLSSSCDGAFTFWVWDNGIWRPYIRLGLEIKTSSDAQFAERKKPEADHLEQTCLYQATLDLPLMWLLYYNKSNSNFTTPFAPWLFKFDKNLWERELEVRFAKAHHHAETKQMPERTEGMHCSWCPFAYVCQPKVLTKPAYGNPVVTTGMLNRRL